MIWATAREARCDVLISETLQGFRGLEGVMVVNPFVLENAAVLAVALPRIA